MNIPEKCVGCSKVESIANEPVDSFTQRIEKATGKKVASFGGALSRGFRTMPQYVFLSPSGMVDSETISTAWFGTRQAYDSIDTQLAEQVRDCPGLSEAQVSLEGRESKACIKICGKTALTALDIADPAL